MMTERQEKLVNAMKDNANKINELNKKMGVHTAKDRKESEKVIKKCRKNFKNYKKAVNVDGFEYCDKKVALDVSEDDSGFLLYMSHSSYDRALYFYKITKKEKDKIKLEEAKKKFYNAIIDHIIYSVISLEIASTSRIVTNLDECDFSVPLLRNMKGYSFNYDNLNEEDFIWDYEHNMTSETCMIPYLGNFYYPATDTDYRYLKYIYFGFNDNNINLQNGTWGGNRHENLVLNWIENVSYASFLCAGHNIKRCIDLLNKYFNTNFDMSHEGLAKLTNYLYENHEDRFSELTDMEMKKLKENETMEIHYNMDSMFAHYIVKNRYAFTRILDLYRVLIEDCKRVYDIDYIDIMLNQRKYFVDEQIDRHCLPHWHDEHDCFVDDDGRLFHFTELDLLPRNRRNDIYNLLGLKRDEKLVLFSDQTWENFEKRYNTMYKSLYESAINKKIASKVYDEKRLEFAKDVLDTYDEMMADESDWSKYKDIYKDYIYTNYLILYTLIDGCDKNYILEN